MQARRPRSGGLACYFRIAGDMPAKKRNADAKGSHSPQDRRRLACRRLYSTANERGYIATACLFALRQSAGETPAIRRSVIRFKNNP
ncbi:MAG: hypothetical protein LBP59_00150 [Planctomycetaceae bacterium]|nr:hypothetical protein [Planctomycetaceae bacterium]